MKTEMRMGALMKIKEAAEHLGMAPTSLYKLCKSGRAPSYAVGTKGYGVRVDVDEVKAALRRPVVLRKASQQ